MQVNKTFCIINKTKFINNKIKEFKKYLIDNGFKYNSLQPNFVFIFGGDGTFVKGIKNYYKSSLKVIPINTGNVGFYSSFNDKNLPTIEEILNLKNYINPDILEVTLNNKNVNAINEITLKTLNTITFDIYINNIFYEEFRGSGILVSTKTGSTGFCKSANGSIIFNDVDAYELVELFPTLHAIKNTIGSPILLNTKTIIKIKNINSNSNNILIADGMTIGTIPNKSELTIKIVKPKFKLFFSKNNKQYIHKLQKTFIKG